MKQKLRVFLTLLLCAVASVGWGEEYKLTISPSDFNTTSYAANNNEKTSLAVSTTDATKTYEVKWTSNQVMKNKDHMQWQKKNGSIYNSTDLGTITSVSVVQTTETNVSFTTYYGTSQKPSTSTEVGGGFFQVKVGSETGSTQRIEVTFEISGGETPIDPRTEVALSFPSATYEANVNEAFESPVVTATPAVTGITYSSSNTNVATVDENSGAVTLVDKGTTIITASFAGDDEYKPATASYTLNVTRTAVVEDGFFNFEDKSLDYGSGVTTTSSDEYITEEKTWTAGNVTLVTSGKYRWWANDGTLRFYSNDPASAMKISVPEGKVITSIDITGGQAFSANVGTYTSGTWTGQAQTVTLSYAASSGSVNVKTVTVTYEDGTPVVEKVDIATLNGISPTTLTVGDQGNFSLDATFVEGLTAGEDYEVNWTSDNTEVLGLEGNTYSANAAGTANVTVSVTVLDEDKYNEVSKSFAVTVSEQGGETSTATATFNFPEMGYENQGEVTTATADGVTLTFDKGTNSNAPKYYTNGTAVRAYGGNTFTISSNNVIKKIEITFGTNDGSNEITTDIESYSDGTWTGSSKSVTFTIGGTTGNRRIQAINVTYEAPEGFVATPVFSVNGGTVVAGTVVTITAEEGNTIVYTTDETDPLESSTAIGPSEGNVVTITINEAMTIKAIAMDEDANSSEVAEATFDIAKVYESIAALIADKPKKATLRLTDAQVLFVGDNDVYVKDATGALDFFQTGLSYSAGDVLNGTIDVAFTMYNTYTPEVTEVSNNNLTFTSGEVVAEAVEANAVTLEKVNYLVSLEGFFNNKSVAGVPVYDKYKVVTAAFGALEDGDYVKVTGIVVNSKGVANIGLTAVEKIEAPTVTVTIKDAGYATFANEKAVDFSDETDLTVLTAKYDAENDKIVYNEVTSKKVPAGVAVVLKGTADDYEGKVIASADALENNGLKVDLTNNTPATGKEYCLARLNGVVGFYKVKVGVDVKAGKAYLEIERPATPGGAKDFYAIEDETDGINAINNSHQTVESVYNLSGQRVNKAQKGIYIVNGKKVVVR